MTAYWMRMRDWSSGVCSSGLGVRRDDLALHIGLAVDGRPTLGAVAIPDRGEVFVSDTVASPRSTRERPIIVVSRTRAPEIVVRVAEEIGADLLPMGSAGAKTMAVVDGRADIYLHAGGQYEWDNCAPARSEEHTSELQSLMRNSYAVF